MDLDKLIEQYPDLKYNIVLAYRGSIAHGMYIPGTDPDSIDDVDLISVVVPPIDCYFGLKDFRSNGTYEVQGDGIDIVAYEVRKIFRLLAGGNPNVLSLLWVDQKYVLHETPAWHMVRVKRMMFVSKSAYYSFMGYAKGQKHRMMRGEFHGHMGEKRKALFAKFGYDTKNAAHMIRLLRMGAEFLVTGMMVVDRGGLDAGELLEIKRGEWSLDRVNAEAERCFTNLESALQYSSLPVEVDREAINQLCVDVVARTILDR